jgi:cytochrome c
MQLKALVLMSVALVAVTAPAIGQDQLTMAALQDADYMQGKQAFQGRCSACHTLGDNSGDIAGPNLWGVFDRVAGSKQGFDYSATLAAADFEWTPDQLDA